MSTPTVDQANGSAHARPGTRQRGFSRSDRPGRSSSFCGSLHQSGRRLKAMSFGQQPGLSSRRPQIPREPAWSSCAAAPERVRALRYSQQGADLHAASASPNIPAGSAINRRQPRHTLCRAALTALFERGHR